MTSRRIKFGLLLDHQFPRNDDLATHIDSLVELTELAAGHGLDGVFGIHHFLAGLQTPQPFQLLARLVPVSARMDLGTSVYVSTLAHPVQIAEELATLDQISRGRVVFGAGIGYRDEEFASFGIPRSSRAPRFIEGLEVIRGLWGDEPFSYSGTYYSIDGQRSSVRPYEGRRIPFWIGANAPDTILRAARIGDAWIASPNVKERWAIGNLEAFREERRRHGLPDDGDRPIGRELFIADTDDEARRVVAPYLEEEYRHYSQYDLDHFVEMYGELMLKSFFVGSPATVAAKIRAFADGGFNYFLFRTFWSGMPYDMAKRTVERLVNEVLPLVEAS
jgi:alkanesulfonate monooxygenase SsuD/methylene tetrahydromethanopterin reductase-like flavin-dependent oxidoreductase (luciferase family)